MDEGEAALREGLGDAAHSEVAQLLAARVDGRVELDAELVKGQLTCGGVGRHGPAVGEPATVIFVVIAERRQIEELFEDRELCALDVHFEDVDVTMR